MCTHRPEGPNIGLQGLTRALGGVPDQARRRRTDQGTQRSARPGMLQVCQHEAIRPRQGARRSARSGVLQARRPEAGRASPGCSVECPSRRAGGVPTRGCSSPARALGGVLIQARRRRADGRPAGPRQGALPGTRHGARRCAQGWTRASARAEVLTSAGALGGASYQARVACRPGVRAQMACAVQEQEAPTRRAEGVPTRRARA